MEVASKIVTDNLNPTCIVCMSDIVAIGCITYLKQHSFNIPERYSVVGFDNIQTALIVTPSLTTVMHASIEKGELAAKTLFELIDGEPIEIVHKILPHELIQRDSLKNLNY